MALHAPALVRASVWHRRPGPFLVLALVFLPFAAALVWSSTLPRPNAPAIAAEVRSTAAMVDDHAAVMVRVGSTMAAASGRSERPDRAAWSSYAQHMLADAGVLAALAARLRVDAAVAEGELQRSAPAGVLVAVLEARWLEMRADGRATAEHGRVMVRMAADLEAGVREGMLSNADARAIQAASAGMVDAGERIARAANGLLGTVDQMRRWTGSTR